MRSLGHALIVLLSPLAAAPFAAAQEVEPLERIEIPGEVIVCLTSEARLADASAAVVDLDLPTIEPGLELEDARTLLSWQRRGEDTFTTLVLVEFDPEGVDAERMRLALEARPDVLWTSPNVGLVGDPREASSNDPLFGSQYHHPLMQNDAAWNITLGDASVVMGVTDDGVDLDHVDLAPNVWTNSGEIPGDGVDNDGNGYVDDVNGFDFVFDNADPNPNGSDDHGTHCAGIAGARTNNSTGVAGTAGEATIMPIQFYALGQPWTAADISEAFAYGTDNGAQIITTSYNINGWVGDPVVTAAFDYLYDQGVLHFNSAGNGSQLNPARQAFHQTFLVVSTTSSDAKSGFSNWGTGVDISAPGSDILSTTLNDTYGNKSGTSMAAPNAAGVAALIWSANPSWTRDQVAAQLIATGDNIDAQNPGLEGLLGGGRVNALRALTETLPSPKLVLADGLPSDGGALVGDLASFSLRFDQILDPATVNSPNAFLLRYAGGDDTFGTADDVRIDLEWDEYLIAGNEVVLRPTGQLSFAGLYQVAANGNVLANPFGTAFDGNGDGTGGDSWTRTFSACATNEFLVDNAESGVDWSVENVNLSTGAWTVPPEVPTGGGARNDPPTDFDGSGRCFLTENAPGNTDVDGGPTRLISRALDLTNAADPYVSFAAWLNSGGADVMDVDISTNDGATWTPLDVLTDTNGWEVFTYRVLDVASPTAQTRLRFSIADLGTASVVEAGIDFLRIVGIDCNSDVVGSAYCVSNPNSSGLAAEIRGEGSADPLDNDFTLVTSNVPVGAAGIYFFGPTQTQVVLGDGFRCVDGSVVRLAPVLQADVNAEARLTPNLAIAPLSGFAIAGTTTNFQFWYRDLLGTRTNLSDALEVVWQ
ncbi:MAG: S8 family serine peptidase [Planctomycetota bacterium]